MLNKIFLIGNLGQDPELKHTNGGIPVLNLRIATSHVSKDKEGVKKTYTEWHTVVFMNKSADAVSKFLRKGSKVYVEGENRTRKFEKDGIEHYRTEVFAFELRVLDQKREDKEDKQPPEETIPF